MKARLFILIVVDRDGIPHPFGSLKDACLKFGYKFNTLYKKKFPFQCDGYTFYRKRIEKITGG